MKTDEKIELIRQKMARRNLSAFVIPSDDPHKSEYVTEHWQARKWVTGFSGSAGTAVITMDKAILWTDFRYYIQAENQIKGSGFELYKMGEPGIPSYQKWLAHTMEKDQVIGLDANVFSRNDVKKLTDRFDKKGIKIDTCADIVDMVWTGRPQQPRSKAYSLPVEFAGKDRTEKLGQIREKMAACHADCHVMATLDDIAWTLNLRGNDVHTNPVNIAFALILPEKTILFINPEKIDKELRKELNADNIELAGYGDVFSALGGLPDGLSILVDPYNTNFKLYQAIHDRCTIVEQPNPAIALKARKNETEIGHIRRTAVKDGVAVVRFLHWLETLPGKAAATEVSVAAKLYEFRKEQAHFVDNSFDPIMAFRDHSAMCHYSATPETDAVIGESGMFLTDSGGNYLTGTTDITRTISRGAPTDQEIKDYTLVLKGHIRVATTPFPKGTKGFQIDTLARQYLWRHGMNFGHGTGHGVGFFLCVHEGPARISPVQNDTALETGMLLTNEPGVYREDGYGIRLENQILVVGAFENEFGKFLGFENVTFCHFERVLIDPNLMSQKEIDWINTYHTRVFEKLSPHLDTDVKVWLKEKTKPI